MTDRKTPHQVLKSIWGFDEFRGSQGSIIQALCDQNDALIVMPTGGGKSICFQVPGLVLPGLTIVISPLVALMENQVNALVSKGVPAALLHSQLDRSQRKKIAYAIETQRLKLLYLSPETLLSQGVMEKLLNPELTISSLILDEAHCLVQWGDTFRPVYQQLGTVRDRLLAARPKGTTINIAAFTATANPVEQATIIRSLNLNNPIQFVEVPYRSNLVLKKQRVWTPRDRRQKLVKFIQSQNQTSGIVYVRTRNDSEELAKWLRSHTIRAASYHAGLVTSKKRDIEKDWMENRVSCVVATSAFGMGVDKPDVRWVVQYQPPLWLSEYVQEIGRAGRDGARAIGLTLVSERSGFLDPLDSTTWKHSIQSMHQKLKTRWSTTDRRSSADTAHLELLKSIPKRSEVEQYINHRGCRWNYIQNFFGNLNLIKPCGHCDRCL
ncbi:MAG: ATP-dependent DNA helicase [Cyanobacteria bacterium]|nr:ATP-dependent DNA helicase [Cyanobacteriota bacterium]